MKNTKPMKNTMETKIITSGMGLALALMTCVSTARAELYNITFTDGGANVGSGQLTVSGGVATGGYLNMTGAAAVDNSWVLSPTPSPTPGFDGYFTWDNVVMTPPSNPFLTVNGLLFTSGSDELNLCYSGSGISYDLTAITNTNPRPNPDVNYIVLTSGDATITPVPEPINYALLAFGLIFLVGSAGRFYLGRRRAVTAS